MRVFTSVRVTGRRSDSSGVTRAKRRRRGEEAQQAARYSRHNATRLLRRCVGAQALLLRHPALQRDGPMLRQLGELFAEAVELVEQLSAR